MSKLAVESFFIKLQCLHPGTLLRMCYIYWEDFFFIINMEK